MNVVDISCLALVAFFAGRGIWRGFVNEWSGLLGLVMGYFAIQAYAPPAGDWLANALELSAPSALLMAKFTLFLAAYLGIVLLGKALTKVLKLVWLGWVNRLAGGLSGLAKGRCFFCPTLSILPPGYCPKISDFRALDRRTPGYTAPWFPQAMCYSIWAKATSAPSPFRLFFRFTQSPK